MRFRYAYLDAKERKKRNYIEAASLTEARDLLKQQGICLLYLKEATPLRIRLSREEVIVFSKQLALLLQSGLPLYESLLSLKRQNHKKHMIGVIGTCIDYIRTGKALSQALSEYPSIFDSFYCNCIAAGEKISNLEGSLRSIIHVLEDKRDIIKKIKTSLSYPLVLAVASIAVAIFFLVSVIPSFKTTFEEVELNSFSLLVFRLSDVVCAYGKLWLLVFGGLCAGIFCSRKHMFWRRWKERLCFACPLIREFSVKFSMWRLFSVTQAILQGGGTLIEGLEFGCQAIPYAQLKHDVRSIIEKVVAGSTLSQELAKHAWAPSFVVSMVSLGEESGEFTEVFTYIVDMYRDETKKILEWIAAWSQPIILVFLGGIIGLIMLAVLLPLTSGIQVL